MVTRIKGTNIDPTTDLPEGVKLGGAELPKIDLAIAPEVLEIQANVTESGQNAAWRWTWTTSSLPYSRVEITNETQTSIPLYKQGTYTINNYAGVETHSGMSQTHELYLKWLEGAGTDNLVNWVTTTTTTDSHPEINGGASTGVDRLSFSVPSSITLPTLTAPSISYTVTNSGSGAYTFSGNAHGDNPEIGPFYRGGTYTFNVSATGHPFYLTTDNGTGFVAGSYVDEYTSGVTGSRTDSGTVTFVVPSNAPDTLYYQCGNHASMRGTIRIKDLAVETNSDGNYVIYLQHTQDGHSTPVEIRPIPSMVDQMCLVYDATNSKFVPQDMATYIERTPTFKRKIQNVAGTATIVAADGTAAVSSINVYQYASYLPLLDNNQGDMAYITENNRLYIWTGTAWDQASAQVFDSSTDSTGYFSLPTGTSAQRPSSPTEGMMRFNTDADALEIYSEGAWTPLAASPLVSSVSPTTFTGAAGSTFTISGSNFSTNPTVKFYDVNGTAYTAASVTRVSSSELTVTTPQAFTVDLEPLSVEVTNKTGLAARKDEVIDCGGLPSWSTASGAIGSNLLETQSINESVLATDPDGDTITYSLVSGSLPPGLSLNSGNGAITGTAGSVPSSGTTYNFTLQASDSAGNTSQRSFSMNIGSAAPVWSTASGTRATQARTGSVNTSISATTISGAGATTYSIASGSLPNGLSLNASTGAITGTISSGTTKQTWTFTARASNDVSSADRSFDIVVIGNTIGAATNAHYYPGCTTGTNRKSQFDSLCIGLESCTFNPLNYGDPAGGSSKSFKLQFPCTTGYAYSTCVSAEAGRNVTHSCPN